MTQVKSTKYWCKHFIPFAKLRRGNVRDARCWVLDNVDRDRADIFAFDEGEYGGGIAFEREEDLSMFLLVWA